ncbi:MAG: hypothetical protein H6735_25760 [Alphaproteobacteria bacterium]|nr:hypothetical protein [Alphaproteobacteria bacterium]
MRQVPVGADRLVVVLSDIEMGAGGPLDDFPHSAWLADLIRSYLEPPYHGLKIDLVFDGDTFDFLKTSVDGQYPRHVTRAVALAKLHRVLAVHQAFLQGVRDFLDASEGHDVHFVIGNHDAELAFPVVQAELAEAIGRGRVHFPGFALDFGDLHVEHGQQHDPMFAVNPEQPLIEWKGHTMLDLPWGSVALLDVIMPMHEIFYALDRVKPRGAVFQLLPEVREVVSNAFWRYFTREYLVEAWRGDDPTRKASWGMLRDVLYRFTTFDAGTSADTPVYQKLTEHLPDARVVVVGHLHNAAWWTSADRKLLQTGCLRDEYVIDPLGTVVGMLPKVYAECFLAGPRTIRSELVEVWGPPKIEGHVPASILELREAARPLLATQAERDRLHAEEQAHVAREEGER